VYLSIIAQYPSLPYWYRTPKNIALYEKSSQTVDAAIPSILLELRLRVAAIQVTGFSGLPL
jgi:hypothetical protein